MPGALNIVTGPGKVLEDALIGSQYCSLVTLTGETVTGRHVFQKAAENLKEYILELGSKNPPIILSGTGMDFAVNTAVLSTFLHQGQICMSSGRIIIEERIARWLRLSPSKMKKRR